MKITNVQAHPISFAIPEAYQVELGIGRTIKRDAVLVKIETEDGHFGWGEAHAARAPTAIAELLNTTLRQLVLGMDARDIHAVWERVYRMQLASHGAGAAAVIGLSGIDMALWDLCGKLANKPLYTLLGGSQRPLAAYAGGISLGYQEPQALLLEVDKLLAAGYGAIKLRLGDTPERDIERLRAVRAHVGATVAIMTDVNTAYALPQIAILMPVLDELDIRWLEEPFPAHDYKSYIAAKALGSTRLAAGENHYTRFEFERVADDGAITIWQPDASKTGGVTEMLRIAALAKQQACEFHPHTSVSRLNMAATIHFLAALERPGFYEADTSVFNPFRDKLCRGGFSEHANGEVSPLDGPGLGVEVDEHALVDYAAMAGPGYV